HHLVQMRARGRGDHEPEVVAVLALIVVVDRGVAADARGHFLQALGRRSQRRERARPQTARCEHRAHPAYQPLRHHLPVSREHRFLAAADFLRDARERPRDEREVALPFVEQAEIGCVERLRQDELARHQKPVRAARVVKKMPLGLAESKPPICFLVAVSKITTLLSSRADSHSTCPLDRNSMCRMPRPGCSVSVTLPVTVSITCTQPLSGKAKFTQISRPSGRAIANTGWLLTLMRPTSSQVSVSTTSTSWR